MQYRYNKKSWDSHKNVKIVTKQFFPRQVKSQIIFFGSQIKIFFLSEKLVRSPILNQWEQSALTSSRQEYYFISRSPVRDYFSVKKSEKKF